jgi:SAM-dependent methyltransferase
VTQEQINSRLYQRPELVRLYGARDDLLPVESTVLVRYRDDVVGRPVLDLGCGGGRLTSHLALLTPRYVGIDVSPHMVAHCRARFPGIPFFERDMRELTELGETSFGAVLAVANLIDAVDHEDRMHVLAEVRRVLAPGGLFAFSSHNRNWALAGASPRLERHRRPLAQLRAGVRFVRQYVHHVRARRFEESALDHAVLNDPGRDYELLHYYITRHAQARQLAEAGFTMLETLDGMGRRLDEQDDDRAWSSIMYVARRD